MATPNPPPTCGTKLNPKAQTDIDRYRFVARIFGTLRFHGWQDYYFRGISERDKDGELVHRRSSLLLGRQGGKSHVLPTGMWKSALEGKHVAFSQQDKGKAVERWRKWVDTWEARAPPALKGKSYKMTGQQRWWLPGRGSIRPVTPNGTHVRGFTLDEIWVDEAAFVPDVFFRAATWTLATKRDTWALHKMSTAPSYMEKNGGNFSQECKLGRESVDEGGPTERFHAEWVAAAEMEWGARPTWERVIPTFDCVNPDGVSVSFVESEWRDHLAAGTPEVFAREMLSVEITPPTAETLALDLWDSLGDANAQPGRGATICVEIARDLTHASIVAAKADKQGRVTVAVVEDNKGFEWVTGKLLEMRRKRPGGVQRIVIDKRAAAGSLIDKLRHEGFKVEGLDYAHLTAYWGTFLRVCTQRSLRHRPHAALRAAVETAVTRNLQEAWTWERQSSPPSCALMAATLAAGRALAKPVGVDLLV